jgi:hypothetical protein
MNPLLRGIIGGLAWGGAPLPSGAGSTRQPDGCGLGGEDLSVGESEAKGRMYSPPQLAERSPAGRLRVALSAQRRD